MLLRNHPLMTYKGVGSWPPAWMWRGGSDSIQPKGEVGVLKKVLSSSIRPLERCFLIIEFHGAEYMGALLLSDPGFCQEIYRVLLENVGRTIIDIGSIDISYTL